MASGGIVLSSEFFSGETPCFYETESYLDKSSIITCQDLYRQASTEDNFLSVTRRIFVSFQVDYWKSYFGHHGNRRPERWRNNKRNLISGIETRAFYEATMWILCLDFTFLACRSACLQFYEKHRKTPLSSLTIGIVGQHSVAASAVVAFTTRSKRGERREEAAVNNVRARNYAHALRATEEAW